MRLFDIKMTCAIWEKSRKKLGKEWRKKESIMEKKYFFLKLYYIQGVPKRSGHLNISGNISFTEKCFRQKLYGSKISIYWSYQFTLGCVAKVRSRLH